MYCASEMTGNTAPRTCLLQALGSGIFGGFRAGIAFSKVVRRGFGENTITSNESDGYCELIASQKPLDQHTGLQLDDYIIRAAVLERELVEDISASRWESFTFLDGDDKVRCGGAGRASLAGTREANSTPRIESCARDAT